MTLQRQKVLPITLLCFQLLFLAWFLFENIFLYQTIVNSWQDNNFLTLFLQNNFLFFPRIVQNLLIVTSFYRVDGKAIGNVIFAFFRAFSYLECLYLLFGLTLYYFAFIKRNKSIAVIGSIYCYSLMLFVVKLLVAILALLFSLYDMSIRFGEAIMIMQIALIVCIGIEVFFMGYLIIKKKRIIN